MKKRKICIDNCQFSLIRGGRSDLSIPRLRRCADPADGGTCSAPLPSVRFDLRSFYSASLKLDPLPSGQPAFASHRLRVRSAVLLRTSAGPAPVRSGGAHLRQIVLQSAPVGRSPGSAGSPSPTFASFCCGLRRRQAQAPLASAKPSQAQDWHARCAAAVAPGSGLRFDLAGSISISSVTFVPKALPFRRSSSVPSDPLHWALPGALYCASLIRLRPSRFRRLHRNDLRLDCFPPTRPFFPCAPLHSAAPPCAVALQRSVSAKGAGASPLHSAPLRESPVLPVARPAQPAPALRVLPPALRPPRMTFVPRPCARASAPLVACFSPGQKASVANTLLCRVLYCLWLHGMAAFLFTAFTTPSG